MQLQHYKSLLKIVLLLAPLALVGCGGDDDDDTPDITNEPDPMETPVDDTDTAAMKEFSVVFVNTTSNQPLSPVAFVAHEGNFSPWSIGEPATDGLADLAESGSTAGFLADAEGTLLAERASSLIQPGMSQNYDFMVPETEQLFLSLATMLENTNDGFAGAQSLNITQLAVGESMNYLAPVYDAGSEANTETAETIPGPAARGAALSDGREENNQVTRHPGVVTQDDGYEASALDESHRFDNGALLVRIERLK